MEIYIKTRQRSENTKHTTQTITIFALFKALFMLRKEDQLKRQALIRDINLIEPYREHLPMYCINAADDEFEQSRQISIGIKTTPWFGVTGFHLRGPRNKGKVDSVVHDVTIIAGDWTMVDVCDFLHEQDIIGEEIFDRLQYCLYNKTYLCFSSTDILTFISGGSVCEKESVEHFFMNDMTYRISMVTPYMTLCKQLWKGIFVNTLTGIDDSVMSDFITSAKHWTMVDDVCGIGHGYALFCEEILDTVQYCLCDTTSSRFFSTDIPTFISGGSVCEKKSVKHFFMNDMTYRISMVTPYMTLCKDDQRDLWKGIFVNTLTGIDDLVMSDFITSARDLTVVDDVCGIGHGNALFCEEILDTVQYCSCDTTSSRFFSTDMLKIDSHSISIVREKNSSLAVTLFMKKVPTRLSIETQFGNHVANLKLFWERRTCDTQNHLLKWLMHNESAPSGRCSQMHALLHHLQTSDESILSDVCFYQKAKSMCKEATKCSLIEECHIVQVGTVAECLASLSHFEANYILMATQMIPLLLLRPFQTFYKPHGIINNGNEENNISYWLVACLCYSIYCKMTYQNSALKARYLQRDEVVRRDNLLLDRKRHPLNENSNNLRRMKITLTKKLILSCYDPPETRFQKQMTVQKLLSYSYYLSNIRVACNKIVDKPIEKGDTYDDSDTVQSRPLENVRVPPQHLYCQKETSDESIRTAPQDLKQIKVCSDMTYRQQKATYGILDIKRKKMHTFMKKKDQAKIKTCSRKETDKNPNRVQFSKTDGIDDIPKTIRSMTWLPLNQLPVPEVDITLAMVFDPLDTMFQMMAHGDTPGPEVTMRYELLRLCTLRNYPKNNKPYIIRLAGAGFYFAAEGDEVVCYCCGLRKSSWVENDSPHAIHESLSPRCSFLIRNAEVNVPVPKQDRPGRDRFSFIEDQVGPNRSSPSAAKAPINVCNNTSHQINEIAASNIAVSQAPVIERTTRQIGANNSNTSRNIVTTSNNHQTVVSGSSGTQIATTTSHYRVATSSGANAEKPKHPTYAAKSVRIASFEGWPNNTGQTVMVMAEAGYYFSGVGDGVRCFFCGIGLRHWTAEDDPWIEHARWSRHCIYLKTVKGEEYISLVHLAMQFTDDNNAGAAANQIPIEEINTIFLTGAAQSVLEMGHEPKLIKQAIGMILKDIGRTGISSEKIMAKVLDIKHNASQKDVTGQLNRLHLQIATPEHTAATAKTQSQQIPRNQNNSKQPEEKNAAATSMSKHVQNPICSKRSVGQSLNKQDNKTTKDPKLLKAENDIMLKQTMCKVCMDNTVSIVFLPCGHLVTCTECAPAMRKCPICRKLIKGTVKAFMS